MANIKTRVKILEEIRPHTKKLDVESTILRNIIGLKDGEVIRIKHSKGYEKLVLECL